MRISYSGRSGAALQGCSQRRCPPSSCSQRATSQRAHPQSGTPATGPSSRLPSSSSFAEPNSSLQTLPTRTSLPQTCSPPHPRRHPSLQPTAVLLLSSLPFSARARLLMETHPRETAPISTRSPSRSVGRPLNEQVQQTNSAGSLRAIIIKPLTSNPPRAPPSTADRQQQQRNNHPPSIPRFDPSSVSPSHMPTRSITPVRSYDGSNGCPMVIARRRTRDGGRSGDSLGGPRLVFGICRRSRRRGSRGRRSRLLISISRTL